MTSQAGVEPARERLGYGEHAPRFGRPVEGAPDDVDRLRDVLAVATRRDRDRTGAPSTRCSPVLLAATRRSGPTWLEPTTTTAASTSAATPWILLDVVLPGTVDRGGQCPHPHPAARPCVEGRRGLTGAG
jgi:hypothetical protein